MHQITPHPAVPGVVQLPSGPVAVLDAARRDDLPARGTVVLVPGYTGSKEDFAPLFDGLTGAGFRVISLDLPGQHESPGPGELSSYAVDVLAGVVVATMDELSPEPVHLLGHSFGGLVCRAAAIAAPARLRSLVLLGSGPAALTGPRLQRMRLLEPVLAAGGMPAVQAAMEEMARLDPRAVVPPREVQAFLRARFLMSSPVGLKGMGQALQSEPDRLAELAATGLPLMVAHGIDDDAWQPATQADMATRLGARLEVIAGAAHSPAVEQPARTVGVLTDFWSGVEDSPRA